MTRARRGLVLLALCAACSPDGTGDSAGGTSGTPRGTTTGSSGGVDAGNCAGGCPLGEGCWEAVCYPTACPSGPCGPDALCIEGSCACTDCDGGGNASTTSNTSSGTASSTSSNTSSGTGASTTAGTSSGTTTASTTSGTTSSTSSGTTSGTTSGLCAGRGLVTTLAGNGDGGWTDGTGGPTGTARFNGPQGLTVDDGGNVYVADTLNNRIRKIDSAGNVTTVVGTGVTGCVSGSDGALGSAELNAPASVALGPTNTIFIGDAKCHFVDRVNATGNVAPFGTGSALAMLRVAGVAVDTAGNVYVGDDLAGVVEKITSTGSIAPLAGNGDAGYRDGPTSTALFSSPEGVAVDGSGNVYVADTGNSRIRKIAAISGVTTVAGNGQNAFADGTGGDAGTAAFNAPTGIAVGPQGVLYVADQSNNLIRKIDAAGNVTTLAGVTADAGAGNAGYLDGPACAAQFDGPQGIAVDKAGNVYVADTNNHRIRVIYPDAG